MKLKDTAEQEFIGNQIRAFEIAGEWIPGIKIIQRTDPFQSGSLKFYLGCPAIEERNQMKISEICI